MAGNTAFAAASYLNVRFAHQSETSRQLWRGLTAMNYTDTTHYLFPVESNPGVVNALPWLDEIANTNSVNGSENIAPDGGQTNDAALANSIDFSKAPALALKELHKNFDRFDTDKSASLSFEELTAASAESGAAQWALTHYRPLSEVCGESYSPEGIGSTEDFIARMQASRHVPIELSNQLFKDSIPTMLGISKQDLKTSLDLSDEKIATTILEGSAAAEKKSGGGYLASSLIAGASIYPIYKLCAKLPSWVGIVGGALAGLTGIVQYSHFQARRHGNDTGHLEEQINKTRQMLGMENLPPVTDKDESRKEKENDEKQTEEQKKTT